MYNLKHNKQLEAARLHYVGKYETAKANLEIYLDVNRTMAIGEHSDLNAEVRKLLEEMEDALSILELIKKLKNET